MAAIKINNGKTVFLKYWLPVIAWCTLIFFFSSVSGDSIPDGLFLQGILFHFFIYACLGFFFIRALKNTGRKISALKAVCFTLIFGIIYGFTDEIHQLFAPERCFSVLDIIVDGIGTLAGGLFYRWQR